MCGCAGAPQPQLVAENGVIHRFFDTSPVSPSGKYAALFELPYEGKKTVAGDASKVVVVELPSMKRIFETESRGWETQMGANVQWGASDADLFFNDVDPKTWKEFAVRLGFKTGKKNAPCGHGFHGLARRQKARFSQP